MYYKRSMSNVRDQGHSVKMQSDHQIIASGIAESNEDVIIVIRSWEIAVCVHVQYKTGQNSPEQPA